MSTRFRTVIATVMSLMLMLTTVVVVSAAKPPKNTTYNVYQDKLGALVCSTSNPKGQTKVAGPFATRDACNVALTTAPSVSYVLDPAAPTGLNGWYVGGVTLTWTVDPAPFYPATLVTTGCVIQSITTDQDATDYTCTATTPGGTTGPVTASVKRDATPPTISWVGGPDNLASYFVGFVPAAPVVTFADALSGVDSHIFYGYDTAVGLHTMTANVTDKAGHFVSESRAYTVVQPDMPVVVGTLTPAAPDGSNGWYRSVVTLQWTVTDPSNTGSLTIEGCVDQAIIADQAATTYSCSATTIAGTTGPVDVTIARDATLPTISWVGGPADGQSYFVGQVPAAPVVTFDDAMSGVDTSSFSGYDTAVGSHTMTADVTDMAGNRVTESRSYTVVQPEMPVVTGTLDPAAPDGSNGWYKSNVTLTWTVTDPSATGSLTTEGCVDQAITSDQDATTYSCSATTIAGTTGPVDVTISRDATLPTISWDSLINNGDSFVYGTVPVEPIVSASDALSGIDGFVFTGYGTSIGVHQMVANALDRAGNFVSEMVTYTVTPIPAVTVDPTATDQSCDGAATVTGGITIPSVTGVDYAIDGTLATGFVALDPGTYQVTATAQATYELSGLATWGLTIAPAACVVDVAAVTPTVTPQSCNAVNGGITIPTVTGITYSLPAGFNQLVPGDYVVTASADAGYNMTGYPVGGWSLTVASIACPLAIEFIGVASVTAAGTITYPAGTQTGDLAIAMATRWGATASTQAPSTPSGWTKVGPTVYNKPGTYWTTSAAFYRVVGAETVTPAWLYAHDAIVVVYRNATIGSVNGASCGSAACYSGASFPALSMQVTNGSSWVAGLSSNSKVATAIGMTTRTNPGTGNMSSLDTNAGVASWASHPATGAQHAFSLELKAQ